MKKFLAGLSTVAVLAAGGVALAGLTSDDAIAQETTDQATVEDEADGERRHRGRHGHLRHGIGTAAETIGIEAADLVEAGASWFEHR